MAGVEVDLVKVVVVLGVDAAGAHEPQGPFDLGGDLVVRSALGTGGHELLRPRMNAGEIGEPALGEGAQQVERRRRLVVGLHQSFGGCYPCRFRGVWIVDHVPAKRRQIEVADALEGSRPWFGELSGDTAHLDHGHAERIGQARRPSAR